MQVNKGVFQPTNIISSVKSSNAKSTEFLGETLTKVLLRDVVLKVFSFLNSPQDLANAGKTCRRWAHYTKENCLWAPLAKRLAPHSKIENNERQIAIRH